MKKKLLLITDHFFAPNQVAALRMQAFVQYLPKDLFEIVVLTPGQVRTEPMQVMGAKVYCVRDSHIFARWKFAQRASKWVHKAKVLWNLCVRLFDIDENPGFAKWGQRRLLALHREHEFDVVIASYASLASVKLGLWLKQYDPQVKLVCDFRDELSRNCRSTRWDYWRLLRWERRLVAAADLVTSVSKPILEQFSRFSTQPQKFVEIRNGYNFAPVQDVRAPGSVLEIIYAGSLYHDISLEQVFKVLQSLPPELRQRFRLKVVGGHPTLAVPSVLRTQVQIEKRVNYSEIPNLLRESDALLLILPTDQRRGVYSGKIFDYLATNRPILALVPPGDVAAALIWEARAGYVCANEDSAGIQRSLERLLRDWEAGACPRRDWTVVAKHHRARQVEELTKSIGKVLGLPTARREFLTPSPELGFF